MESHASHPGILKRLRRAHGHLGGVMMMIEEGRSCVELAQQLHAVEGAIANAKRELIKDHMEHCLGEGLGSSSEDARSALQEFKALAKYL